MALAQLNGFLPSDFAVEQAPKIAIGERAPAGEFMRAYPPVEIRDARPLQKKADSEAQFFQRHGFVLLSHGTQVEDWDSDVGPIYLSEVEALIRERLLPGRRLEVQQRPNLLRRGRGTATPQYANGVHSDGPLTLDAFASNIRAFASPQAEQWWRTRYAEDEVVGYVSLDFWRTTNMAKPLRHMPLALCDPNSLDRTDIVPMSMTGIAPEGRETNHLSLRFNSAQRWYYYSGMTGDELLVFKLGEYWKDDPEAHPQNCFHSAFRDPAAPADAQERQSCEHRVGVLILRD